MADVASTTDDQKRALLSAVAQQGSAGAQAYQQYADSVASQRAAAVAAAQQRSSLINAGPAATSDLAGTAVATADPYAKDAATGATAYANESGRLAQANSNYMEQLKAAIPLSANYAQGRIESAKAKKAGSDNPFAALLASLGGEDSAKAQLPSLLSQAAQDDKHSDMRRGNMFGLPKAFQKGDITPEANKATINAIEKQTGIPAGTLSRFLGKESPDYVVPDKPPTAAAKNKSALDEIRKSPSYQNEFGLMTEAYHTYTDKHGKYKMSATAAKQKIAQTARSLPTYSANQDAVEQALKDLR